MHMGELLRTHAQIFFGLVLVDALLTTHRFNNNFELLKSEHVQINKTSSHTTLEGTFSTLMKFYPRGLTSTVLLPQRLWSQRRTWTRDEFKVHDICSGQMKTVFWWEPLDCLKLMREEPALISGFGGVFSPV